MALRLFRRTRQQAVGLRRFLYWGWRIGLVLLVIDLVYIAHIWPDWQHFGRGKALRSQYIDDYLQARRDKPALPPLHWAPVSGNQIPAIMRRAVVVAEDARFYHHHGIDLMAFKDAMDTNLELGRFKYGGSTISQQTVKNLYFSGARTPLRKWHELILTLAMEMHVSKYRILTTYLNIAEFGEGVYGVQAAAEYYWQIPASQLNMYQAAELAACLPSPKKNNPLTHTRYFTQRRDRILSWLQKQNDS